MSIARRLISGTMANSAGIAMNAVLQVLTVPLLVSAWGQDRFGLWIILTTIPTYFALTDLGFVQAATSDMTINYARGDKKAALATFQSIWLLFAGSSLIIMCAASSLFVAQAVVAEAAQPWIVQNAAVVVLLICYSALSLLSRVTVAGFRSTGNYAIGSLAYDSLVLLEGLAGLVAAYSGGDFIPVVLTFIAMRMASMVVLYAFLRRRVPWLRYGLEHASRAELKRLLGPALGAMAIPVALAINLQGVVLVIGAVLSPAAVALYTPVRTASRLIVQVVGVLNRATMPEIGRAAGENAEAAMKKLIRLNFLTVLCVLLPGGLAFALFGQDLVRLWSGGHIVPPRGFVAIMALATVLNGCWTFMGNILLATNSHGPVAKYLLFSAIASIPTVYACAASGGLLGAANAILVVEIANIFLVHRAMRKRVTTK
jgi:O-antigen/teichoic acid export membrane protein